MGKSGNIVVNVPLDKIDEIAIALKRIKVNGKEIEQSIRKEKVPFVPRERSERKEKSEQKK
jgi:hypothetical protein